MTTTFAAARNLRVSTAEVAKLFGVTPRTVQCWVSMGILNPSGRGVLSFDMANLLAGAICCDLRARGFQLDQCGAVANWLQSKTLPKLQAEWREGRRFLLSVGSLPPFPRQLTYSQIFENEGIDLHAAFEVGVPVAVVDVEKAFHELCRKVNGGSND